MNLLRKQGRFIDSDLRRQVDDYMYTTGEDVPEDILGFYAALDDTTDDDEYWSIYHLVAITTGLEK